MIFFTIEEYFYSAIYALGLGIAYSAALSFLQSIMSLFRILPTFFYEIFNYSHLFAPFKVDRHLLKIRNKKSAIGVFISILSFSFIFLLISYVTLDGVLRIYLLIVLFASFYVSNFAFSSAFAFLFSWLVTILLTLIAIPIRLIYAMFKVIVNNKLILFFRKQL